MGYHTNITHVIMYSLLGSETPIFLNQPFPKDIQQNTNWFMQKKFHYNIKNFNLIVVAISSSSSSS
jgi:hypothetical protein